MDDQKNVLSINYSAEETPRRFHLSPAMIRGIRGPVGSGKSVSCVMQIFAECCTQRYDARTLTRKSRWACIRNTYPELKSTTIKTFRDWVPEEIAPIKWDAPITAHMKFTPDGVTTVDAEILFLSADKPKDIGKLKSLELTGVWLNEASELPKEIFDMAVARVGRYPSKQMGGSARYSVIMDTNSPDDDHWWYKLAEEPNPDEIAAIEKMMRETAGVDAPLMEFFTQPGALLWDPASESWKPNPLAENIGNLSEGYAYYYKLIPGRSRTWIEVYVGGNYGRISEGRIVYPEYNDQLHVSSKPLEPIDGLPIVIGLDFGLTPAAAITQVTPKGQLRQLGEVVTPEHGSLGIRTFLNDYLKPYLLNRFGSKAKFRVIGDPAGVTPVQTDERTCFELIDEAGFDSEPAITNAFLARREAVAWYLTRLADGEPAFLLDPSCKYTRKGFNGGYYYRRLQLPGEARYRDEPEKSKYSHVHDGLQYAALHARGAAHFESPKRHGARKPQRNRNWRTA